MLLLVHRAIATVNASLASAPLASNVPSGFLSHSARFMALIFLFLNNVEGCVMAFFLIKLNTLSDISSLRPSPANRAFESFLLRNATSVNV